eukprot:2017444-Pleurochrysis_carterae.AAC.2
MTALENRWMIAFFADLAPILGLKETPRLTTTAGSFVAAAFAAEPEVAAGGKATAHSCLRAARVCNLLRKLTRPSERCELYGRELGGQNLFEALEAVEENGGRVKARRDTRRLHHAPLRTRIGTQERVEQTSSPVR